MAMTTTLRCVFKGAGDRNVSMSFPNADATASANQIKTLMQMIVVNGDIFTDEPQSIVGAEFIVREIIDVDVS